MLDDHGAISREYLAARGFCCDNGCRNCPYRSEGAISGSEEMIRVAIIGQGDTGEGDIGQGGIRKGAIGEIRKAKGKSCPRCRASFSCFGAGCWCAHIRLDAATLERLRRDFQGCLCPKCLADYAESASLGASRKS